MSQNWNPEQPQQPPWGYPQQENVQQHVQQNNPQQWQGQPYYPPSGWQQYPPQPQFAPSKRPWMRRHPFVTGFFFFALLVFGIGIGASLHSKPSQGTGASGFTSTSQAAAPATSAAANTAAKQTVTFEVTGSQADVTYGPAGTSVSGTVPMKVTKPLGNPIYYSLQAQLQGGGTVTCKIKVDGKVIAESVASGGYNIADCEISQDPLSGDWSDTNAG